MDIFIFLVAFLLTSIIIRVYINWSLKKGLLRANYCGENLPFSGGIIFPLVIYLLLPLTQMNGTLLVAYSLIGVGIVGFIDDLYGDSSNKGFSGHLTALFKGYISTGLLKIIVIMLISFTYALLLRRDLSDTILIILILPLMANTFNLLDLKPGRTLKGFFLIMSLLLLNSVKLNQVIIIILGSAMAIFPKDIKQRLMLGDSGSNLLGFAAGIAVIEMNSYFKYFIIIFLIFLNLLSEFISLGKIINKNRVLNFFDRLGQIE